MIARMSDQPSRPPNIVYILADDLGYGDVSRLNPDSKINTPRMDALASQGMTFTDAHSNSAVCTPTRYGVLTGRYCWRSRLKEGVLFGYDDALLEPDRLTVASFLKQQGYDTACIGKWHLGLDWRRRSGDKEDIDYDAPIQAGPHTAGFDHSFIIPASLDMAPYCYIEDGRVVETPTAHTEDSPRPPMWRGGPCAPGFDHATCLLEFTTRAEAFIQQQATTRPDRPFFLYFPTPSPHTPHFSRPPFAGKSQAGTYGDYVIEHDWAVGRVIDAIDRHGLGEDTLIIVTSDNGAHMRGGAQKTLGDAFDYERQFGHRSNHIYRGQKSDAWDGGHRIPFFARWTGRVPAGATCERTVCLTDLIATAAELNAAGLPDDAGEDSVSLLPLLLGQTDGPFREATVHHSVSGRFAIRQGPWKLIECKGSGGWSLSDEEVPADAPPMQLYHVQDDPEEQRNLHNDHPDVVSDLLALLDRYRQHDRSVPAHRA